MKSILTPFQKAILEGICQEKFITENFVFGGGTALSEFYLKHRYSEDFDFFTENEIPLEEISTMGLSPCFFSLLTGKISRRWRDSASSQH